MELNQWDEVDTKTWVGVVGNSGTSAEVNGTSAGIHLHMEIFIGNRYWTNKKPEEIGSDQPRQRYSILQQEIMNLFHFNDFDKSQDNAVDEITATDTQNDNIIDIANTENVDRTTQQLQQNKKTDSEIKHEKSATKQAQSETQMKLTKTKSNN